MDPLPKPDTSDPIVWIACSLVAALAGALVMMLKAIREERREALSAFSAEMKAQRDHDASLVKETHNRLDHLAGEIRNVALTVAKCPNIS